MKPVLSVIFMFIFLSIDTASAGINDKSKKAADYKKGSRFAHHQLIKKIRTNLRKISARLKFQVTAAASLQTKDYSPEHEVSFFREMNPLLWRRLGLDAIQEIYCDTSCLLAAKFTVTVDVLKNSLALQTNHPDLPYLDIMLLDRDGHDFSLSELPFPWLQIPEVVAAIQSISDRNNEKTLTILSNQMLALRRLAKLLQISPSASHLCHTLNQLLDKHTELNAIRVNEQDLIELYLQHNDDYEPLLTLYDKGKLVCKEQHLVVSLGRGARDTKATYRIYEITYRLEGAGIPASVMETPSGNLIDWALAHDADYFTIVALTKGPYSSPVSLRNLLTSLQLPLGQQRGEYNGRLADTEIPRIFTSSLTAQGINVAETETEYGSLVDYAMAVQHPEYWVVKNLYDRTHIDATIPQLERAIELSIDGGDEALPLAVIWKLQEQGVDLTSWRNAKGETFAQYGYRLGVPDRTLSILYYLKNSAKRPPSDFYHSLPSVLVEPSDFQTSDINQYQNSLHSLLTGMNYSEEITPGDGHCFYSALDAMYGVNKARLKQKMLFYLNEILTLVQGGGLLNSIQEAIFESLGNIGIQQAINNISNDQWGEQSYLPLAAATLSQFFEVPSGIYALTPDYSSSNPVISLYNPDGSIVTLSNIEADVPILVYNGIDHWTYALPLENQIVNMPLNNAENNTEPDNEAIFSIRGTSRLMPEIMQ